MDKNYRVEREERLMGMKTALLSSCGKYRYVLKRKTKCPLRWVKKCVFIMLNPSIADANIDDPTVRRCVSFAEREGCTDLSVVNLFALRSTDPDELLNEADPQGPENHRNRRKKMCLLRNSVQSSEDQRAEIPLIRMQAHQWAEDH